MVELIKEKRELFSELILEVIEEIGLANAIREGRQNKFVSEDEIVSIVGYKSIYRLEQKWH